MPRINVLVNLNAIWRVLQKIFTQLMESWCVRERRNILYYYGHVTDHVSLMFCWINSINYTPTFRYKIIFSNHFCKVLFGFCLVLYQTLMCFLFTQNHLCSDFGSDIFSLSTQIYFIVCFLFDISLLQAEKKTKKKEIFM